MRKTFKVSYYSQLDKRWAGKQYGSYNFGKTGCGQASIAMIISGFGKRVTPNMAADYSHKYGSFDNHGEVGSAESDLTMVADHYGVNWHVMGSAGELSKYLAMGYPATVCLDLGGGVRHIVVLSGYAAGGYTNVSDPWSGLLFSGRHTVAEVWHKLSWKADNRNKGASAAVVYIGK
ncbi:C39 family peptidase [Lacticaseibacillus salsurivasis]|uniref:C39 family peptidase n=1 Tax=Lacticaseibacillus salsurivasis TaxID=3081441 RepID=UPI0030C74CCE